MYIALIPIFCLRICVGRSDINFAAFELGNLAFQYGGEKEEDR